MGFDVLVVNRIHHKIKKMMKNDKALEFLWNIGNRTIFTHVLHTHYSAPKGFDFENPGIPAISSSNIQTRSNLLVQDLKVKYYKYIQINQFLLGKSTTL